MDAGQTLSLLVHLAIVELPLIKPPIHHYQLQTLFELIGIECQLL